MEFERRIGIREAAEDLTLRARESATLRFSGADLDTSGSHRLFFTGETGLFYLWKNEPDMPTQYRSIEDALDAEHARRNRYCLNMSCRAPLNYVKRAAHKFIWPPILAYLPLTGYGDEWTGGISVKTSGLRFAEGGYLRLRFDIWRKREGENGHKTGRAPDETRAIDFEPGTREWTERRIPLLIPKNETSCLIVTIEGEGYEGEAYFEAPELTSSNGYNVLPDFNTPLFDEQKFDWLGQNLSRKEWPEFKIALNGAVVFDGEVFERSHRYSEVELPLPAGLLNSGENELTITYTPRYRDPLPYNIREVALSERGGAPFSLVACPEIVDPDEGCKLLVRTFVRDVSLELHCPSGALEVETPPRFAEPGLYAVALKCTSVRNDVPFTLSFGGATRAGYVRAMIARCGDGVVTGTGDMIYVRQEQDAMESYFEWYAARGIGKLLTIRPTYRWSGTRVLDAPAFAGLASLMNGLGMKYALMLDGRELPGIASNPPSALIAGAGFLGRQTHERDGQFFYWGERSSRGREMDELCFDIGQRIAAEEGEKVNPGHCADNIQQLPDGVRLLRFADCPPDMRAIALEAVKRIALTRKEATRHTGPAVTFKYFYEAGYEWLGAELMYGSMEPTSAFLRGASKAYGKRVFGAHHAVQWSSSPHDVPDHWRRYRLALYVSYMQDITEINTEEGLWRIEEYYSYFNRFSDTCERHLAQQADFARFVASHRRTGRFHAPMAVLHGRCDGWHAFTNRQPWGRPDFKFCDAERSWDLLRAFYPLSKPGAALYVHGCKSEPQGYYTGTPLGCVDAYPVEKPGFEEYGALAFMGYNLAKAEDFDRLLSYVRAGGALIMGWAHLNTVTNRARLEAGEREYLAHPLTAALTGGAKPAFVADAAGGAPLSACENLAPEAEILERTDGGRALTASLRLGAGRILLLNAEAYPGDDAVRGAYERLLLAEQARLTDAEPSWMRAGEDVEFSCYDQEDGSRRFYALAVDWYRAPETLRRAELRVGARRYGVEAPFGRMINILVSGDRAVWTDCENADIASMADGVARLRGYGAATIHILADGRERLAEVDFGERPELEISL